MTFSWLFVGTSTGWRGGCELLATFYQEPEVSTLCKVSGVIMLCLMEGEGPAFCDMAALGRDFWYSGHDHCEHLCTLVNSVGFLLGC